MSADKTVITTPKGVAVFPALQRPDTKFDELGMYKADLRVPLQEAKPFMDKASVVFKDFMGKAPSKKDNTMWKLEEDENGEETGNVILKMRVKNKLKKDGTIWNRRPRLFDAKNNVLGNDINPWGGTVMRVSAEMYCWNTGAKKGVSLQPLAVQIVELVSGTGGSSAGDFGFEEEEGFVAETNGFNEDAADEEETDEAAGEIDY